MQIHFVLDFGNTSIKTAIFRKDKMVFFERKEEVSVENLQALATNHKVQSSIFSVTGKISAEVYNFLKNELKAIELDARTPLPIKNDYTTPETLGKDRIAAAVGTFFLHKKRHCLIVDAGTCLTFNWLTKEGEYLGGNIAPGVDMRLKAMHHFTAKLPLVKKGNIENPIAKTTEAALRNGAVLGALYELEGYVRWGKKNFGQVRVVLTGGDADLFVKNSKRKIFAHPNLVLFGLHKILEFNA